MQIGGTSYAFSYSGVTTRSFYGCIRNIYDNNRMYDLHNPLKVVNAPLGCTQGCQSECKNEGYCEAEMYSGTTCCTCVPGFTGCDCSERKSNSVILSNWFHLNFKNGRIFSRILTEILYFILCRIPIIVVRSQQFHGVQHIKHSTTIRDPKNPRRAIITRQRTTPYFRSHIQIFLLLSHKSRL